MPDVKITNVGGSREWTSEQWAWKRCGGNSPVTPAQRFWPRVDVSGPLLSPYLGRCWLWRGSRSSAGYGRFPLDGAHMLAHRFAYESVVGSIPEGLDLDHLCRVRACCNPAHLEPVTRRENLMRGIGLTAINAAKTHCLRGHEFNDENTYIQRSGSRICRACKRDYMRDYRRRAHA